MSRGSTPGYPLSSFRDGTAGHWNFHSTENSEEPFRYAAREPVSRRPSSQEILGRLSELRFVEAVRGHIDKPSAEAIGWLAALRDPALSRALAALHSRPAHAWTAEELAKQACLSRSAFAERFGRVVGLPPLSYLTRWRMLLASQRLRECSDTIAPGAEAVGYESESTFSRAFIRQMGIAPARGGDPARDEVQACRRSRGESTPRRKARGPSR